MISSLLQLVSQINKGDTIPEYICSRGGFLLIIICFEILIIKPNCLYYAFFLENKPIKLFQQVNYMTDKSTSVKELLLKKGVRMPNPQSVEIGEDVNPEAISNEGVTINTGCKIYGHSTYVLMGASIGSEGPVTLESCFVGPDVKLKSGSFKKSVFLSGAVLGPGSQVREGTIFEEEASIAHTVGLKQTILFPFVTLGSLINFCDCFMSGGTSRKNHSEVGSSYIHFNFTPNQDKATPSLIGDVPKGVMLNQPPIFLGGQGGLVGPCRFAFGTTIAAGSIWRKDELRPGRLLFEGRPRGGNVPHTYGVYKSIKRIVKNNLIYIANLKALLAWYHHIRRLFISDLFPDPLFNGLTETLTLNILERIKQLERFCLKLPASAEKYEETVKKADSTLLHQKNEFFEKWSEVKEILTNTALPFFDSQKLDQFSDIIEKSIRLKGKNYISVIQGLNANETDIGTGWLQEIVDNILENCIKVLPSFL